MNASEGNNRKVVIRKKVWLYYCLLISQPQASILAGRLMIRYIIIRHKCNFQTQMNAQVHHVPMAPLAETWSMNTSVPVGPGMRAHTVRQVDISVFVEAGLFERL